MIRHEDADEFGQVKLAIETGDSEQYEELIEDHVVRRNEIG